jgi:hypothetical protein
LKDCIKGFWTSRTRLDALETTELNAVQALLIYNIGEQEMTAGELRT